MRAISLAVRLLWTGGYRVRTTVNYGTVLPRIPYTRTESARVGRWAGEPAAADCVIEIDVMMRSPIETLYTTAHEARVGQVCL